MSRPASGRSPRATPLIALVNRADRELQADMIRHARAAGYETAKPAHNALFASLPLAGARTAQLAERAGITRQSMGEVVRDLVDLGIVTMASDPHDRRAKVVTYTEAGLQQVQDGMAHIADVDDRIIAALGQEGYDALRRGLDTIVRVLRAE
jgi:DNA-binding MarR family transcriptional regulator